MPQKPHEHKVMLIPLDLPKLLSLHRASELMFWGFVMSLSVPCVTTRD